MKHVILSLMALATVALAACSNGGGSDNRVIAQTPLECQTARYINGSYYNQNNQIINCAGFDIYGQNNGFIDYNGSCPAGYSAILSAGNIWQCAPHGYLNQAGFHTTAGLNFVLYPSSYHYGYYNPYAPQPVHSKGGSDCSGDTIGGAVIGAIAGGAVGNNIGSSSRNGLYGALTGAIAGGIIGNNQCD